MRGNYSRAPASLREIAMQSVAIFGCPRARAFIRWLHRSGRVPTLPDPRPLSSWEDEVKELNLEEVLRIAGGVPVSAALDELTYRAPEQQASDPADFARLL